MSKSKVIRCPMFVNVNRMHVRLNSKPLDKADCLKYLGSQVAADRVWERDVVHRMNGWFTARRVLTSACAKQYNIWNKCKEVFICISNCANGVLRSRGMGYEKW